MDEEALVAAVRAHLQREARLNLGRWPISLFLDRGALVLEGEVGSVAAKKRALEIAAAVRGVDGLIDRLHVEPTQRMTDAELERHVLRVLAEESSLRVCELRVKHDDRTELARAADGLARGQIDVSVREGVVTLDGDVPGLAHKRLAESVAWWVPGTRDVVNGLGVTPPEEDSDDEITDALRMVLEKDPLLRGLQIGVTTDHRVVTLTGAVHTEQQRRAAEEDGWCLFGVDGVESRLELRPAQ